MNLLILKLGATGDVVRTTTLLRRFDGPVTWITAEKNARLLQGLSRQVRCLSWENRNLALDTPYDLVINLEDDQEASSFVQGLRSKRIFGAFLNPRGELAYTDDSRRWFDLSLISTHGRQEADRLKLLNRCTYQELVFQGLGYSFAGEEYLLPPSPASDLQGDVALSPVAGPVWPMKAWAFYSALQQELESRGLKVNVLPTRASLIEHLADVRGHRCLVSGDSLPMHLALGSGVKCVSIFTCTSPWEIHEYGLQIKLVSPLLEKFFYKRDFDPSATTAIGLKEVLAATLQQVE